MPNLRATASFLISLVALCCVVAASDSLGDLPKKAVARSQITAPGSQPFLLKAKVVEVTNVANMSYHAEIEEEWMAPDKWRRTVTTANFSETLIVNGNKMSEQITGDYYPNWLRTIVAAMFDPGDVMKDVDLARSNDNPMGNGSKVCRRFTFMAGVAPVSNKVFSSYCFNDGLLDMVVVPGYEAIYRDYKDFGGKHVARTINEGIESGADIRATIEELTELKSPDEAQFAVQEANAPLKTIRAKEETLRSLAESAPEIAWPTDRTGKDSGTLSLYVCLDRWGHPREIYELNSSNAGLSDVARDQVMKWKFKTASNGGAPVQVEGILTFAFHK